MSEYNTESVFGLRKVQAACWLPPSQSNTRLFASGSWGDESNKVHVYNCRSFTSFSDEKQEERCRSEASADISSDVMSIFPISPNHFAVGTDDGRLVMYELGQEGLTVVDENTDCHQGSVMAMDLSGDGSLLASADSFGSIVLHSTPTSLGFRTLASPSLGKDSSDLYDVKFQSSFSLLACGVSGRVRMWDLRQKTSTATKNKPTSVCMTPHSDLLTCLAIHPSRPIFAAGSGNGIIHVFDQRKQETPVSSLQAHDSYISDMSFLIHKQTQLVTSGHDGAVNLWDFNKDGRDPTQVSYGSEQQHNIEATNLLTCSLPVNSLSFQDSFHTLLCGTDLESVVLIDGL